MIGPAIDMGNLTDRELLLLVSQKVMDIESQIKAAQMENVEMQLKLREVETKMRMAAVWISILVSLVTSVAASVITFIITTQ